MATGIQQQPLQQLGGAQPEKQAPITLHPLIDSRIIPSIQEHMEAVSDQSMSTRTFSPDDFSDEVKPILSDQQQLQGIVQKLSTLGFDAGIAQLPNGTWGIRVAWAPEEGKGKNAEEWWEGEEEEQPWELGEHKPVEGAAGAKQAELPPRPVAQQGPQAVAQAVVAEKPTQQLPQQQQPGGQLGQALSQFAGQTVAQVAEKAGGNLPSQVFQGFGGRGRGGRGRGRGRRGGFGGGGFGGQGGANAGAGQQQAGGQAGANAAQANRQGIQGPFGRFAGYFFAGFPAPSATPSSLQDFLKNLPAMVLVLDNWVKSRLVLIGDLQPLDKALQRMNRHRIISVPVLDESTRQIRGVLDVQDVIHYLSDLLEQPLNQALNLRWDFSVKDCGSLLDIATKPFIFSNQSNLWDILQYLAKGSERALVVDKPTEPHELTTEEGDVVGMIVQMDFIRFLSQHNAWLRMHPKFDVPLNQAMDLNNLSEKVVTITPSEHTYLAFRRMNESNVRGVAVVDNEGRIIANLSASNIRGISRRNFQVLRFPLGEFLRRDRRVGWWQTPIYVKATDPFGLVFFQFAATGLHRLYILDNNNKPTHVIVPADILKTLASF
jgi:CBS-domain-containing membrane protein